MRFKDLAVGKYVTLNRWLRYYYKIELIVYIR